MNEVLKNVLRFYFSIIVFIGCSNSTKMFRYEDPKNDGLFIQREYGASVVITMNNGEEYKGELLRVRENSMILCSKYKANEKELFAFTYPYYSLNNHDIKIIELTGENHLIGGIVFGGLGGALLGALIGSVIALNASYYESIGYAAGGFLIGAGIGMLVGGIIGGNNTTINKVIYKYANPEEYDFTQLNIYARYGEYEPDYLKAIK